MQIIYRDKQYETKPNITARDAIKKIGLDPEAVLVVVNGKIVTDDVMLREGDEVKLVAVVSGGALNGIRNTCCVMRVPLVWSRDALSKM